MCRRRDCRRPRLPLLDRFRLLSQARRLLSGQPKFVRPNRIEVRSARPSRRCSVSIVTILPICNAACRRTARSTIATAWLRFAGTAFRTPGPALRCGAGVFASDLHAARKTRTWHDPLDHAEMSAVPAAHRSNNVPEPALCSHFREWVRSAKLLFCPRPFRRTPQPPRSHSCRIAGILPATLPQAAT